MSKWEMVKLGEICTVIAGQSPPSTSYNKRGEGLPFFQGKADFGDLYPVVRNWCVSPKKVALPNDVLISVRAPVGPTNLSNVECCIGRGLSAIRTSSKINTSFLIKYLRYYEPKLASQGVGSTFHAINQNDIKNIPIPLPPLSEQKRIVDHLDRAQGLIDKRKEQIKLMDSLIQSLFYEMFGDPVRNEKGWEVKELGEVAPLQGGYAFKSKDYKDIGVKLVKITNVHKEYLVWDEIDCLPEEYAKKYPAFSLKRNDIVLAMTRPIIKSLDSVKVAQVRDIDLPCLLNQRVGKFAIKNENILSTQYLYNFCLQQHFKNEVEKYSSVSLQPNVSNKQIDSIGIVLPPFELQQSFADRVKKIVAIKQSMETSLKELEHNFNSLMQQSFSGG